MQKFELGDIPIFNKTHLFHLLINQVLVLDFAPNSKWFGLTMYGNASALLMSKQASSIEAYPVLDGIKTTKTWSAFPLLLFETFYDFSLSISIFL